MNKIFYPILSVWFLLLKSISVSINLVLETLWVTQQVSSGHAWLTTHIPELQFAKIYYNTSVAFHVSHSPQNTPTPPSLHPPPPAPLLQKQTNKQTKQREMREPDQSKSSGQISTTNVMKLVELNTEIFYFPNSFSWQTKILCSITTLCHFTFATLCLRQCQPLIFTEEGYQKVISQQCRL